MRTSEYGITHGQTRRLRLTMPKGDSGSDDFSTTTRLVKTQIDTTLGEAVNMLRSLLPKFIMHAFTKTAQANFIHDLRIFSDPETVALQVDFAENYSCEHQDEIQSAHWQQKPGDSVHSSSVVGW